MLEASNRDRTDIEGALEGIANHIAIERIVPSGFRVTRMVNFSKRGEQRINYSCCSLISRRTLPEVVHLREPSPPLVLSRKYKLSPNGA